MVFPEPGNPKPCETYDGNLTSRCLMERVVQQVYSYYQDHASRFHRGVRNFLDLIYPELNFDEQLRHVWITEGRLCTVTGSESSSRCVPQFLRRQLSLFSGVSVIAFGRAQHYLTSLDIPYLKVLHPTARKKESTILSNWQQAIDAVKLQNSSKNPKSVPSPVRAKKHSTTLHLPRVVGAFFDTATKTTGYRVECGKLQVMLYHDGNKLGGWNTKERHWYFSKVAASGHSKRMRQNGFRWLERSNGHGWWQIDDEDSTGAFRSVVEELTGVSVL